ncbi:MAG: fibronectin type III domain-containing protein [Nitrospira sp.]|nr:fibronectin type III domain-containing protein [Nitrospira sp.]MDH4250353.1 fibronectin type III domain-containing protein [Nitrospira sp.]MDH4343049.1 fibronectin type III domain-containing protein [Nitrospira sp.]MDH5334783.1 fibronectin type III domain-containing protein [Nitrospira sp.]
MLRHALSTIPVKNFIIELIPLIVLSTIVLPLAGCSDNGQGGPSISSLSTPTDNQQSENTEADTTSTETAANEQDDPTISEAPTEIEPFPSEVAEADPEPLVAGPEGEAVPFTPTDATARLTWAVNPDPTVIGYHVYYGKESSGEPGSCSYETSQSVEAPPAIITGLEPNTPYFFAISAFGGEEGEAESPCSNEVLMISSPAQG